METRLRDQFLLLCMKINDEDNYILCMKINDEDDYILCMKINDEDDYILCMKINDEDNYILFCKRATSDVLEGVTSKNCSGGKPQNPILQ